MRLLPSAVASLLVSTSLVVAAPDLTPAYAAKTCAGLPVTIDLRAPDHPDPDRPDADVVIGTPRDDYIDTGAGDDVVCSGRGDDYVMSGPGDDRILGGSGADHLFGGAGDDELRGGRSASGNPLQVDVAGYADAPRRVAVSLSFDGRQRTGWGRDLLVGIEGVSGSEFGDELVGGPSLDFLDGRAGDDLIAGLAGDDYLFGDTGDDVMAGGPGDDELEPWRGDDISFGGAGEDHLNAYRGRDEFWGGRGADLFRGSAARPVIRMYGGHGDDIFEPGLSDEVMDGGRGRDTVDYSTSVLVPSGPGVRLDLREVGPQETRRSGTDTVVLIERVVGSEGGNDRLRGDDGANELIGLGGSDLLIGRRGDDLLDGGAGEDRCLGGPGADRRRDCEG